MKTDFKSAFFDTAPFIYLIEGHPQFAPITQNILIHCQNHSVLLTTSVLTMLEFKTKPLRHNRIDIIEAFDDLIADFNVRIAPVTISVVKKALHYQSQLLSLKAMDAMQLGAAAVSECDVFITNDKRLNQLDYPQIITLDQWT